MWWRRLWRDVWRWTAISRIPRSSNWSPFLFLLLLLGHWGQCWALDPAKLKLFIQKAPILLLPQTPWPSFLLASNASFLRGQQWDSKLLYLILR
jgi:hypothetical protein